MTQARLPLNPGPQSNIANQTAYRHLQSLGLGTFSAHKNTDQLNIPSGVPTQVTFDHAEYNPSNWYSTTTSRFHPKMAGYYRLNAAVVFDSGIANKHVTLEIWKDGAHYVHLDHAQTSATDDPHVSGSVIVKADGSNYFEIYIEHDFGVDTKDILAPTGVETNFFQGELISIQGA